jgi:hypothetical protein
MTTSTNTSNSPGAAYTFDTYTQTFGAADSGIITFDTASPNNWTNAVGETTATVEAQVSSTGKNVAEAWASVETQVKSYAAAVAEAWASAETNGHVWGSILAFAETWATAEAPAASTTKAPFAEAWSSSEGHVKGFADANTEAWTSVEVSAPTTVWQRAFSEVWATVDNDGKAMMQAIDQTMAFADLLFRNAKAVYQEFQVRGAPLTIDDVISIVGYEAPIGYSPLIDFVAGDYDYQKALFQLVMTPSSTSGRPALTRLSVSADMPDVIQSGTATISSAGTLLVKFDKIFTVPPAVSVVMLTAATGCTAVVVGVPTATGFTCGLQVSAGVYTTGSLSWTAVGR